jgi:hypothetical protein
VFSVCLGIIQKGLHPLLATTKVAAFFFLFPLIKTETLETRRILVCNHYLEKNPDAVKTNSPNLLQLHRLLLPLLLECLQHPLLDLVLRSTHNSVPHGVVYPSEFGFVASFKIQS